jgi:hypothetical protein
MVGVLDENSDTENARIGGSTLTEITEVAVRPTGPLPASAVMTATPPGWLRNADLNSSAVIVVETAEGLLLIIQFPFTRLAQLYGGM